MFVLLQKIILPISNSVLIPTKTDLSKLCIYGQSVFSFGDVHICVNGLWWDWTVVCGSMILCNQIGFHLKGRTFTLYLTVGGVTDMEGNQSWYNQSHPRTLLWSESAALTADDQGPPTHTAAHDQRPTPHPMTIEKSKLSHSHLGIHNTGC